MAKFGCSWHTRNDRSLRASIVFLVLALLVTPAFAQVGPGGGQAGPNGMQLAQSVVERPPEQAVLVQLLFGEAPVGGVFTAFQDGNALFVPLGLLVERLQLGITVDLNQGRAQGFFLNEGRIFALDLAQGAVVVEGRMLQIPPGGAELQFDDIFIDTNLFGQWFPADLIFDPQNGTLSVVTREIFPFEAALAREAARNQGGGVELREDFDLQETPFSLFSVPFADVSTQYTHQNANAGRTANDDGAYTATIAGDLLFMNARLALQGKDGELISDARIVLERRDPNSSIFSDVKYIEALKLSQVAIGDVFTPQVPFIASQGEGRGVVISSFPLSRPAEFDRETFRGELPIGWEVELFRNGEFIDFRSSRVDGRYEFIDIPLRFGENEFRLEFFGPQGQRRTESRNILVGPSQESPGQEFFTFAYNQDNTRVLPFAEGSRSQDTPARFFAEYQRGVTQDLSLAMRATSVVLNDLANNEQRHTTFGVGVRFSIADFRFLPDAFVRADFTQDLNGGHALVGAVQTDLYGVSLFGEHAYFVDLDSERLGVLADRIEHSTILRANGDLPTVGRLPTFTYSVETENIRHQSGEYERDVDLRISTIVNDVSLVNDMDIRMEGGRPAGVDTETSIRGNFLVRTDLDSGLFVNRTALQNLRMRAMLDYTLQPEKEISGFSISTEALLPNEVAARLDIARVLGSNTLTTYSPSLSKAFKMFSLNLSGAFTNRGSTTLGVGLSFGVGQEPRTGRIITQPTNISGQGITSIRTFLDTNGNGHFDAGEPPLPGIAFRDAEFNDVVTDAQGIAFVTGLAGDAENVVEIDQRSIEDPFIQPNPRGVDIIPRPGVVSIVDFPFSMIGEIDGFVLLQGGQGVRPLAEVPLELVDAEGNVVDMTESTFDGFYLFSNVFPGRYTIRISPELIERQGIIPPPPLPVEIGPEGTIVTDVNIIITG